MEFSAILGIQPGTFQLWELRKMAKFRERQAWDRTRTIVAALTGKLIPNPQEEEEVTRWKGWGAYGLHFRPKSKDPNDLQIEQQGRDQADP